VARCDTEPRELAELTEPRLVVQVQSDQVIVTIEHADECAHLGPRLAGTLNGKPMGIRSRGGECQPIVLVGGYDINDDVAADIHIEDPGAAIDVSYDHLLADGTFELVAPADGDLFAGDRVTLRWPYSDDTLVRASVAFLTQAPGPEWSVAEAEITGDRIEVSVPADEKAWSGVRGGLRMQVEVEPAAPRRCDGVVSCTVEHTFPFRREVAAIYTSTPRP
jgi:hypothetical protein